jgi:hypothetical protein
MENTLENKAKFFAQYWGQDVLAYCFRDGVYEVEEVQTEYPIMEAINQYKDSKLELKHISSISDEDAINIAKEIFVDEFIEFSNKETVIESARKHIQLVEYQYFNKIDRIDCFRSKGYALPYNGLSVEKQIEYGWVKLKEN